MNKVEIQAYKIAKRQKCDSCDRLESIERRLVLWQENQVMGDLELCELCLNALLNLFEKEEEIIQEWVFAERGVNNG